MTKENAGWLKWWIHCTNIWVDKLNIPHDEPQCLLYNMKGAKVWYEAGKTAEEFVDSEVELRERYLRAYRPVVER